MANEDLDRINAELLAGDDEPDFSATVGDDLGAVDNQHQLPGHQNGEQHRNVNPGRADGTDHGAQSGQDGATVENQRRQRARAKKPIEFLVGESSEFGLRLVTLTEGTRKIYSSTIDTGNRAQRDQFAKEAGQTAELGFIYRATHAGLKPGQPAKSFADWVSDHILEHQNGVPVEVGGQRQNDAGTKRAKHDPPSEFDPSAFAPLDVVTNAYRVKGDDGSIEHFAMTMAQIRGRLEKQTPGWPSRVGSMVFIDDKQHGLAPFGKHSQLFGWLASQVGKVEWYKYADAVGRDEFFAELARTARAFKAIESYPHFPPLTGHYYSLPAGVGDEWSTVNPSIEPKNIFNGDSKTYLDELVDRFAPQTEIDRDLILALLVTPAWGGPGGARPGFVITARDGRGCGKTTLTKTVGRLYGGCFDISMGEDIATIKKRLLTSDAATKRCMLIDNIKGNRVSWAELESLITCAEISGHKLYHGEASRPNTLLWMLTLNGPSLSRDLAQRCVTIELRRPDFASGWQDELNEFVELRRWDIFRNIASFFGRPPAPSLACTRWGAWERAVLGRFPFPEEMQKVIAERQAAIDADDSEAADIEDHFRKELERLGYDPATDSVHVPNEVARAWYGRALGVNVTTTATTRAVSQAADEGLLKRLRVNPSRAQGRGFLWSGGASARVLYDLEDRQRDSKWQQDDRYWDR